MKTFSGKISSLIIQDINTRESVFFISLYSALKDTLMAKTIADTLRDTKICNLHCKERWWASPPLSHGNHPGPRPISLYTSFYNKPPQHNLLNLLPCHRCFSGLLHFSINMQKLKFKSPLTVPIFAAINQRSGNLRKQINGVHWGQKVTFFAKIGGFQSILYVSVFHGLLIADINI